MSRKVGPGKARSVDDMDLDKEEVHEPQKISLNISMELKSDIFDKLRKNYLEMIASRTQAIQRKMIKTRSRPLLTNRFHQHQNRSRLIYFGKTWQVFRLLPYTEQDWPGWLRSGI